MSKLGAGSGRSRRQGWRFTANIKEHYLLLGLVIALAIGAILRFKGLTTQGYWLDELISIGFSNPDNSFSSMYRMTVRDVHPPLYQTLLWLWFNIFGFTEFAGRVLSAIFGVFGIYAIYLLGKELFDKSVGVYSSLIASVTYFLIYYSQEVRSYNLLFLLSTLSYVYFIRSLYHYTRYSFALYLIFTLALINTHYFGFFLLATQFIVFVGFFYKQKDRRKSLSMQAGITAAVMVVSVLPIIRYIFRHAEMVSFWIPESRIDFFIYYYATYFDSKLLGLLLLISMIVGSGRLLNRNCPDNERVAVIFLMIWIFFGYLFPFLRSITSVPLLTERNTIIILPAIIVLAAYGMSVLPSNKIRGLVLTIVLLLGLYGPGNPAYYKKIVEQQWREVLYEVDKQKQAIPSYDLVFDKEAYKSYALMLGMSLDIYSSDIFRRQYKDDSLPDCFWVLESHGDWISGAEALNDKAMQPVLEFEKVSARGVLYANGVEAAICVRKYYSSTS